MITGSKQTNMARRRIKAEKVLAMILADDSDDDDDEEDSDSECVEDDDFVPSEEISETEDNVELMGDGDQCSSDEDNTENIRSVTSEVSTVKWFASFRRTRYLGCSSHLFV